MKHLKLTALLLAAALLASCTAAPVAESIAETTMETTAVTSEATEAETEPAETVHEGPYDISEITTRRGVAWVNDNPDLAALVRKYKYGYDSTGSYLVATDDDIVVVYNENRTEVDGVTPVDQYTTYDIASCSKLFTAVCIFQLVEEGRMSLDDTLDMYFPEYELGSQITIYNMLHMRSGIADYVNEPELFWMHDEELPPIEEIEDPAEFFELYFPDGFFSGEMTEEEFLEHLYQADLVFEPGSQFAYSNTNYRLLAFIVEHVTGMRFCDYLQENIFDVCGMDHTTSMIPGDETSLPEDFEMLQELGVVDENGHTVMPDFGDGGIHTCTADLLAFDRALFTGRLVSEESFEEMNNMIEGYGCGLMPYEGALGVYHSGGAYTYITMNIIRPSDTFGHVYVISMMRA